VDSRVAPVAAFRCHRGDGRLALAVEPYPTGMRVRPDREVCVLRTRVSVLLRYPLPTVTALRAADRYTARRYRGFSFRALNYLRSIPLYSSEQVTLCSSLTTSLENHSASSCHLRQAFPPCGSSSGIRQVRAERSMWGS
jgi:hypothetical protein